MQQDQHEDRMKNTCSYNSLSVVASIIRRSDDTRNIEQEKVGVGI